MIVITTSLTRWQLEAVVLVVIELNSKIESAKAEHTAFESRPSGA